MVCLPRETISNNVAAWAPSSEAMLLKVMPSELLLTGPFKNRLGARRVCCWLPHDGLDDYRSSDPNTPLVVIQIFGLKLRNSRNV